MQLGTSVWLKWILYPEKASPATALGNPDVGWASTPREKGNRVGIKKRKKYIFSENLYYKTKIFYLLSIKFSYQWYNTRIWFNSEICFWVAISNCISNFTINTKVNVTCWYLLIKDKQYRKKSYWAKIIWKIIVTEVGINKTIQSKFITIHQPEEYYDQVVHLL